MAGFFDFIDPKTWSAAATTSVPPVEEPKPLRAEDLVVVDARVQPEDVPDSMEIATKSEAAAALGTLKTSVVAETPMIVMMPTKVVTTPSAEETPTVVLDTTSTPVIESVAPQATQEIPVEITPQTIESTSISSVSEISDEESTLDAILANARAQLETFKTSAVQKLNEANTTVPLKLAAATSLDQEIIDLKKLLEDKASVRTSLGDEIAILQESTDKLHQQIALAEEKQKLFQV